MKDFSIDTAGFAALTITELLLQHCVMKGVMTGAEVTQLLGSAIRRHETASKGIDEKTLINTEAARLITAMVGGLSPLLNKDQTPAKSKPKRKRKRSKESRSKIFP
ncbi:MAG: hypothetical protein JKY12_09375 [Sneathiella sp.]|nr:hypothetical protein [Sneathiella sp.]